jgi:hypothetical protein
VSSKADSGLRIVPTKCCVCDTHVADLIGSASNSRSSRRDLVADAIFRDSAIPSTGALRLADETGLEVPKITTIVSRVNWDYSLHNLLIGINAPSWVVSKFTPKSPGISCVIHSDRCHASKAWKGRSA